MRKDMFDFKGTFNSTKIIVNCIIDQLTYNCTRVGPMHDRQAPMSMANKSTDDEMRYQFSAMYTILHAYPLAVIRWQLTVL